MHYFPRIDMKSEYIFVPKWKVSHYEFEDVYLSLILISAISKKKNKVIISGNRFDFQDDYKQKL